jgi:hypothetical protein
MYSTGVAADLLIIHNRDPFKISAKLFRYPTDADVSVMLILQYFFILSIHVS